MAVAQLKTGAAGTPGVVNRQGAKNAKAKTI